MAYMGMLLLLRYSYYAYVCYYVYYMRCFNFKYRQYNNSCRKLLACK